MTGFTGLVAAERSVTTSFTGLVAAERSVTTGFKGLVAAERSVTTSFTGLVAAERSVTTNLTGLVAAEQSVTTGFTGLVAAERSVTTSFAGLVAAERSAATSFTGQVAAKRTAATSFTGQVAARRTSATSLTGQVAARRTAATSFTGDVWNNLLLDFFADTTGALLSAHTMNLGPGWTVTSLSAGTAAAATIQSNQATISVGGLDIYIRAVANGGATNKRTVIGLKVNTTAQGLVLALIRYADANNWTAAKLDATAKTLRIIQSVAGIQTTLTTNATGTLNTGNQYDLQMVGTSTTLRAFLSGPDIATVDSGIVTNNTGAANTIYGFDFYRNDGANYHQVFLTAFQVA